jgi:hypothetical protein
MASMREIRETAIYISIAVVTYMVIEGLTIVTHEFTHSTSAWLLGYMPKPFSIVWGNPVTFKGWDEGVPYRQLFPSAGTPAEAAIGGSPLVLHTIVVVVGLLLLQRQWMAEKKWLYHLVYWIVVVGLTELIAYIVMRPFTPGGDTGHFNRGLGISPWLLFIVGTSSIIVALYVLFTKVLPVMDEIVARGNQLTEWSILLMTSFVMFLWGSGIRVLSLYPHPPWMFGLLGIAAFVGALFIYHPRVSPSTDATS